MARQDIKALLEKINSGNFTHEEERIAKYWLLKLDQQDPTDLTDEELEAISKEMWASLEDLPAVQPKTRRLWLRIAAAASVIIALSAGGYFLQHKTDKQPLLAQQDINPGGNKAILVLANGKQLNITNAINGKIASQQGATIQKTANGEIVYQNDQAVPETEELNIIKTPKGGKWNLTLADGTKVWLNAASSITYPAKFIGTDRKVSITGEAYFEVVHDSAHPFKVEFNGQTVQDIGTHFNINTYADEPVSKTTLLEGSIKINGQLLKPGQVGIINGNKLSIEPADAEETMAWKNGSLYTTDEPLTSIMRKVSRQYDVDIVYKDDVSDISMGCAVTTTKKISTVLNYIHKIEKHIDFTISGRTVTVFKK